MCISSITSTSYIYFFHCIFSPYTHTSISLYWNLNLFLYSLLIFFTLIFYWLLFAMSLCVIYHLCEYACLHDVRFLSRNESVFNFVRLTSQWISLSLFLHILPFDIRHMQLVRPLGTFISFLVHDEVTWIVLTLLNDYVNDLEADLKIILVIKLIEILNINFINISFPTYIHIIFIQHLYNITFIHIFYFEKKNHHFFLQYTI